jgi:hypothetical protein
MSLSDIYCDYCAATWGLDENGQFKTDEELKSSVFARFGALFPSRSTAAASTGSVAQRVLHDLREVVELVDKEAACAEKQEMSAHSRGSRLLFLFQRDLLPGISGKILESKGQRDSVVTTFVSKEAKVAGWVVVAAVNLGMWAYILLFALSQPVHRQGAWALSFVMWLIVDVFLVSSSIVLFMHVLMPSLIMKDVRKIKQKLVDNIREFNRNVSKRSRADLSPDEVRPFNAADYLFVSTRLAQQWSELREAQIIAQFRTPWPKQSYQRESNVSKSYSKKYSALVRSASVIAVFFLTQLLQIPAGFQDMVVRMASTTVIGYTILAHIDLYEIFPVLAFVPAVCLAVAAHYYIKRASAAAEQELCRVHVEQVSEEPVKVDEAVEPTDAAAVSKIAHPSRRQSVQHGINVANRLQQELQERRVATLDDAKACDSQLDVAVPAFPLSYAGSLPIPTIGEEQKSGDGISTLDAPESGSPLAGGVPSSSARSARSESQALAYVREAEYEEDEDSDIYDSDALSDDSEHSFINVGTSAKVPALLSVTPSVVAEYQHQPTPEIGAKNSVPHSSSAPSDEESYGSVSETSDTESDAVVPRPRANHLGSVAHAALSPAEEVCASTGGSDHSSTSDGDSAFDSLSSGTP